MMTCAPFTKSPNCASQITSDERIGGRVTVFEADHRFFRQHRIDDLEGRLPLRDVLQRHVALAGRLLVQHGVAMEERAAARVLAGDADGIAFFEDAGVRQRFGRAPVQRHLAAEHLGAIRHDLRHARMQREVLRETAPRARPALSGARDRRHRGRARTSRCAAYLLQSTVYLLPIMPSEARACCLPASRPWRYCSTIAAASASVSTPCATSLSA